MGGTCHLIKCELRHAVLTLNHPWYGMVKADIDRQKGIADEYEIDPKLNEGHTHQYHDVKRKRSERKQMHGGDCECCRGVSFPFSRAHLFIVCWTEAS